MRYILKKAAVLFLTLFLIVSGTFLLMKSIPGDPFSSEQEIPKEIMDNIISCYGLDKPLYIQYFKYIKSFLTFDFGSSLVYQGRTVFDIISSGFPYSATIGCLSILLALSLGVTLGSVAALFQNRWPDKTALLFSTIGISVPNFLIATLLQYLFAIKLSWLPVARVDSIAGLILPVLSLSALPIAYIAKLTRNNLIEVLKQDYIKTALLKGLGPFSIIVKHGLRNALLPVITYMGPLSAYVLTGSFVIEKIFGIPGLGQWLILSITNRDYPIIMGLTLFYASLLILFVFFVDVIYSIVDPRIRINSRKCDV